ncbi:AAA family ATPase [Streptomyces sp. CC224B]|uniref:ParA family protein n=1 Tax=Streptomyces sp. CC224B TaxID=3044571 RepID=UPI0024A807AB|nr:AAA family ATPase [Streptomyces sp. CC224B]
MTTLPPGFIPFSQVLATGPSAGPAKVYAVVNQSGGAGKTTSAVNIAACAAEYGWRTLIVDGDAQCDASVACGYEPDELEQPTLYDVLLDVATFEETIVPALAGRFGGEGTVAIENLYIALASSNLEDAEQLLATRVGREFWLRGLIDAVRDKFDLIIIDCPGNLGLYVVNAIVASDEVIGCVKPGWKELRALTRIEAKIEELQRVLAGVKAHLSKVLVVDVPSHRSQGAVYDDSKKTVASAYEEQMLPMIRRSPRIPEAYAAQKPLRFYDRAGEATQNYYDVTKALGFRRRTP